MGFPLELITMLGSGLLGGFLSLTGQWLKAKIKSHEMMLGAINTRMKHVAEARQHGGDAFKFTRRVIALAAVGSIVVLPKLVAVYNPEINVLVGYTEMQGGFFNWLFGGEGERVQWQEAKGFVITPLDTHLMSAIVGLYFGASSVRNG